MNILTYILAAVFVLAGAMKMMQPKTKLETKMAWVKDVSSWQVKAIAALEALAALALALPLIFDTGLILVPLAATGLVFLMLGAVDISAAPLKLTRHVLLHLSQVVIQHLTTFWTLHQVS